VLAAAAAHHEYPHLLPFASVARPPP
jgi:hypothetical protein